jgi:hypothetical protein
MMDKKMDYLPTSSQTTLLAVVTGWVREKSVTFFFHKLIIFIANGIREVCNEAPHLVNAIHRAVVADHGSSNSRGRSEKGSGKRKFRRA